MIDSKLEALLTPAITHLGYEYWGIEQNQQGHRMVLCIYIDKPGGVTLQDCARVSSDLSALLEAESHLEMAYVLEVSSPGVERVLFTLAQYQRFIGQAVNIKLYDKIEERRQWQGVLTAVTENDVVIAVEDAVYHIPFVNIKKGHIVY